MPLNIWRKKILKKPYFEGKIGKSLLQFLSHPRLFFHFRIKEKYPQTFDDICLYSEVSHLLSHCTFRLPCRRFIQELFQDVQFLQVSRIYTLEIYL